MFFSRLGEPQRLQAAVAVRRAEPDDRAVGAHHRAQAALEPVDPQRLALPQPRFLGGAKLGARQTLQQIG